jgi:flagellar M-ring protein FliF
VENAAQGTVDRLRSIWDNLTNVQRGLVLAGAVLALALVIYAIVGGQSPDYATLYTGLEEADAAAVVDELKALAVPYRLAQGGSAIQVPARQVYDVRLEMAKQGLPKGQTVGFELFDGGGLGSMGMTDFMQRVNYQRALEGELARTIGSLEPVTSARVHIVIPEDNLFLSEKKEPTASITLQLDSRYSLSREQVKAVIHLVSSSVEGLTPGHITVVDVAGNVLAAAGEGDNVPSSLQASTGQYEVKRTFERDLEGRLQAMLDQSVGLNAAIVRVTAEFNWDEKQVNSETYVPTGEGTGLVRSQQSTTEAFNGEGTLPGGVTGVDANTVPGYPAGVTGDGTSEYTRDVTTVNYEISRVEQLVKESPGTVERLSVAVLLDESVPEDQAVRLEAMLLAAAGLDNSRGDSLVVQRIPFNTVEAEIVEPGVLDFLNNQSMALTIAKMAALLLAMFVLLRFARVTFSELSVRMAGDYVPYVREIPTEYASLPDDTAEPRRRITPGMTQEEVPQPARELPEPNRQDEAIQAARAQIAEMQEQIQVPVRDNPWREPLSGLVHRRPELIADLIEDWMGEH